MNARGVLRGAATHGNVARSSFSSVAPPAQDGQPTPPPRASNSVYSTPANAKDQIAGATNFKP